MLRHVAADALYDAKTSLARFPPIALPLQRIRGRGELIDDDTQVVIEAFPRMRVVVRGGGLPPGTGAESTRTADDTHMRQVLEGVRGGCPR